MTLIAIGAPEALPPLRFLWHPQYSLLTYAWWYEEYFECPQLRLYVGEEEHQPSQPSESAAPLEDIFTFRISMLTRLLKGGNNSDICLTFV